MSVIDGCAGRPMTRRTRGATGCIAARCCCRSDIASPHPASRIPRPHLYSLASLSHLPVSSWDLRRSTHRVYHCVSLGSFIDLQCYNRNNMLTLNINRKSVWQFYSTLSKSSSEKTDSYYIQNGGLSSLGALLYFQYLFIFIECFKRIKYDLAVLSFIDESP